MINTQERDMQFGLRQFLVAVIACAFLIGNFLAYGGSISLILGVVSAGAFYCLVRTIGSWQNSSSVERFYGLSASTAAMTFWLCLMLAIGTSSSWANQRATRSVAYSLTGDERFDSIVVRYHERKGQYISIWGTVDNQSDFMELKANIDKRNFTRLDGIRWKVTILETQQHIEYFQQTADREQE